MPPVSSIGTLPGLHALPSGGGAPETARLPTRSKAVQLQVWVVGNMKQPGTKGWLLMECKQV